MTPKATSHVIQGMQKDTSKSKLSKEFAFDAKNIRITAREDNSLLTITNEKGNKKLIYLSGYYVGHCVLNNQLVLFTTTPNEEIKDHIFLYDSNFVQTSLYDGNLNFNVNNPLETLGVYENESIQKVYWVDGINQPRVINIKASEESRNRWSDTSFDFIPELALQESVSVEAISNSSMFAPGVIQYAFSYYNKYGQESNIFDVTPLCYITHKERGASPEEVIKDIAFKIRVDNVDTSFDYIRIYSIHRTSLEAVPTVKRVIDLPISIPEKYTEIKETVSSYELGTSNKLYFKLKSDADLPPNTTNLDGKLVTDTTYPYPSENATIYKFDSYKHYPYDLVIGHYDSSNTLIVEKQILVNYITSLQYKKVKLNMGNRERYIYTIYTINDSDTFILKYNKENPQIASISYIDNGTLGETIDPTQLLYIGGEDIIAGTITQKDNTLFLGNIELKQLSIDTYIKDSIKNITINTGRRTEEINTNNELFYSSDLDVINKYSYYKAGEHYRLGIQFQYKNGKWSEPLFITDFTQDLQMRPSILVSTLYLPSFSCTIPEDVKNVLHSSGFKKMRGLVVFPEAYERKILAQGMLCPTLFNPDNRKNNSPYVQSSWFLRPYLLDPISEDYFNINNNGPHTEYEDNLKEINKGAFVEFRHRKPLITGANRGSEIQNNVEYLVDQSILDFYSPDINYDSTNSYNENVQMRIVGLINFTSNYGDIDIQSKTPPLTSNGKGFIHRTITNRNSGGSGLISGLYYDDGTNNIENKFYLVYPWHRNGSLNSDNSVNANSKNRTQSAILEKKKISNIKFSKFNTWLNYGRFWDALGGNGDGSLANGISKIEYFNSDQVHLLKLKSNAQSEDLNYYGNIDTLISNTESYPIYYGTAWADKELSEEDTIKGNDPVRVKYKTTPHLTFKLNNSYHEGHEVVLPNIRGINSVNGNTIILEESYTPESIGEEIKYRTNIGDAEPTDAEEGDLWLKEEEVWYLYYPYGDGKTQRLLKYSEGKWDHYHKGSIPDKKQKAHYLESPYEASVYYFNGAVGPGGSYVYLHTWKFEKKINITPSESKDIIVSQDSLNIDKPGYPYLYLAELYVNSDFIQNAFGGNTEEAIKNNLWLPASQSIPIDRDTITYEYGDTRYQRYDCLKTYAFTPEDENQIIEIASFMCETRHNLLGRYDKNIGNLSNLNADPTNFNLFNPVYSQKDNFFNYRILDSDVYKLNKFTNTITWSKEKHLGEDVDTWTNITMASTLDLDGTKGKVNKLITFKDQIFAFQDKGISNILFNSRVQIPVSDGVPVEISNGMKVDGNRYISDNIGCQNKNSIVTTPSGIYFLDSESNGIYLLADGLTNLSINKGFAIWTKEVSKDPSFKSFYDKNEKDVYFTTKDYCLGYSEKLGQFTSFYDYTDVETMFNVGTGFYSIKVNSVGDQWLYQHSVGNYNEFYGELKPYYLTIISNEDPQVDKVFTNLDYRADFFDSNNNYLENESFDTLEVWNEYQRGKETLEYSKFKPSNLKKKFRMWGANIPRDQENKLDRMRNPWLYIKLSKENPKIYKMELHDLVVKYLE